MIIRSNSHLWHDEFFARQFKTDNAFLESFTDELKSRFSQDSDRWLEGRESFGDDADYRRIQKGIPNETEPGLRGIPVPLVISRDSITEFNRAIGLRGPFVSCASHEDLWISIRSETGEVQQPVRLTLTLAEPTDGKSKRVIVERIRWPGHGDLKTQGGLQGIVPLDSWFQVANRSR